MTPVTTSSNLGISRSTNVYPQFVPIETQDLQLAVNTQFNEWWTDCIEKKHSAFDLIPVIFWLSDNPHLIIFNPILLVDVVNWILLYTHQGAVYVRGHKLFDWWAISGELPKQQQMDGVYW